MQGAGYAVFSSLHGYCSGKKPGVEQRKDRSNYCPVNQLHKLQPTNVIRALGTLAPGSYRISSSLGVLPRGAHAIQQSVDTDNSVEFSLTSTTHEHDDREELLKLTEVGLN